MAAEQLGALFDAFALVQGVMLHVSASCRKLLELAEEMELKKRDQAGLMREFLFVHLRDFLAADQLPEDLLTTAEKQFIVRHELDNIRALSEDPSIPGYPNFRMYEGQSIGKLFLILFLDCATRLSLRVECPWISLGFHFFFDYFQSK